MNKGQDFLKNMLKFNCILTVLLKSSLSQGKQKFVQKLKPKMSKNVSDISLDLAKPGGIWGPWSSCSGGEYIIRPVLFHDPVDPPNNVHDDFGTTAFRGKCNMGAEIQSLEDPIGVEFTVTPNHDCLAGFYRARMRHQGPGNSVSKLLLVRTKFSISYLSTSLQRQF